MFTFYLLALLSAIKLRSHDTDDDDDDKMTSEMRMS
jgi:hypothetical protein